MRRCTRAALRAVAADPLEAHPLQVERRVDLDPVRRRAARTSGYENHTSHPAPGEMLDLHRRHQRVRDPLPVRRVQLQLALGQLAGNHFATLTTGQEQLAEMGRRVLWEGAQEIEISEGLTVTSTSSSPAAPSSRRRAPSAADVAVTRRAHRAHRPRTATRRRRGDRRDRAARPARRDRRPHPPAAAGRGAPDRFTRDTAAAAPAARPRS